MDEHEFCEVVRVMKSVDGFVFPENEPYKVLNDWKDTFCGLRLLVSKKQEK